MRFAPSTASCSRSVMNIILFGPNGMIGREIATEALARGHNVAAASRSASTSSPGSPIRTLAVDATSSAQVAAAVRGFDAIVSAVGPGHGGSPQLVKDATGSLIEGARAAKVNRLIVVGGAGSLFVKPGVRVIDTPDFPAAWRDIAQAHVDVLAALREVTDVDWVYVSPAALIQPGTRTGHYRRGTDDLLVDDKGESRISTQDYAVAILDELENPRASKTRIHVAY